MRRVCLLQGSGGVLLLLFGLFVAPSHAADDRKDYRQALTQLEREELFHPEDPRVKYNKGNVLFRTNRFEEAAQAYKEAASLATDHELKRNALFNLGNALYESKKLKESLTAYDETLRLDPKDIPAKENREFVEKELQKEEEQQKQKQEENKEENPDQQQQPQNQPSEQKEGGEKKDESGGQEQKAQTEQKGEEPATGEEGDKKDIKPDDLNQGNQDNNQAEGEGQANAALAEGEPSRSQKEASRREMEMWLNSLKEGTGEFLKRQMSGQAEQQRPEKDW